MSIKDKIEELLNESAKLKEQDDEDEIDKDLDKKVQEACEDDEDGKDEGKDKKPFVKEPDDEDEDDKDSKDDGKSEKDDSDDEDEKDDKKSDKKNPFVKEDLASLVEALSRKDFNTVAGIVAQIPDDKTRKSQANLYGNWFAGENSNFKMDMFEKACNTHNIKSPGMHEEIKMVDVKEDVDALLNGETLSEEFREKATTIFEAAVMTRVRAEVALVEEKVTAKQEAELRSLKEDLVDKIDGYLDYTVEAWFKDNEIALESGIKNEIYENFIGKLKDVFVESYIQVPEDKFDLVEGLAEEAAKARTELNEAVEVAVEYKRELNNLRKEMLIKESSEGLAMTDAARFKELTEELVFNDEDSFKQKLSTIKESYNFGSKEKTNVKTFVSDTPALINEETEINSVMQAYLKHLK